MRKYLLICGFLLTASSGNAQEQVIQNGRHYSNSLLQLLRTEDRKEKKEELLNRFYDSGIDGFPLLLLELGQKLLKLGRKRKT